MPLNNAMQDLRRMRRSTTLRDGSNPDDVAATLEKILFEAINLQNSGSRSHQSKSLAELKQIRKDLVAGQVNAGSKGNQFVGLYGHVIDQIEGMAQDNAKTNAVFAKGVGALQNSIPSPDSLIAALMTANPLMGYGVKILRDVSRSRKEAVAARRSEDQKRLSVLQSEAEYIKGQLKNQESEEVLIDEQTDVAEKQKREYTKGGVYKEILTRIHEEIKTLQEYMMGAESKIERVEETLNEQIDSAIENSEDLIHAIHEENELKERNEKLARIKDNDDGGLPLVDHIESTAKKEEKKGGLLDMLLGAPLRAIGALLMGVLGSVAGVFAGFAAGGIIATLLKPVTAFFGAVKVLASKILLPLTIVNGIIDFFDGFFNADKIIGKDDANISFGERVLAAYSNMVAQFWTSIAKIVNWVASWFGIDELINTDDWSQKLYSLIISIPDKVMAVAKSALDFIVDTSVAIFESMREGFNEMYDSAVDSIKSGIESTIDKAKSIMDSITGVFARVYTAIQAKIADWGSTLSKIPGIGHLFEVDKEGIKLSPNDIGKAEKDLKELSSSTNLLRIGDGTATMVPLETASSASTGTIRKAEQSAAKREASVNNTVVNAPTSNTSVNNNSFGDKGSTSNNNAGFRNMSSRNYGSR
jgi:putative sterol carrier protein